MGAGVIILLVQQLQGIALILHQVALIGLAILILLVELPTSIEIQHILLEDMQTIQQLIL